MSDTVRNHLARTFYFRLRDPRTVETVETYVIAIDACSLMRVYYVNSRTVNSVYKRSLTVRDMDVAVAARALAFARDKHVFTLL